MKPPGRALAIAELIRIHGVRRAAELVREADAKHRELLRDPPSTSEPARESAPPKQ